MKKTNTNQRLLISILYIVIIYTVYLLLLHDLSLRYVFDLFPVTIVTFILYKQLIVPYFSKPQDVLATAVSVTIATILVNHDDYTHTAKSFRIIFLVFLGILIFISVTTIISKNKNKLNKMLYDISQVYGSPEIIFAPLIVLSIFAVPNSASDIESFVLVILLLLIMSNPFDLGLMIRNKYKNTQKKIETIGVIDRIDMPNIARILLFDNDAIDMESTYICKLSDKNHFFVKPLDLQFKNDEFILTGYLLRTESKSEVADYSGYIYRTNNRTSLEDEYKKILEIEEKIEFAGLVVENSSIFSSKVELKDDVVIENGQLLIIPHNNLKIYYQCQDAITSEELFVGNPKGKTIITASQLGIYDPEKGFKKYSGSPSMNVCAFVVKEEKTETELKEIGTIKNSNFNVDIDINKLVEYHAAILGVTGTGKTEFAFKIINKTIEGGFKVFCVDITGEYRSKLKHLNPTLVSIGDAKMKDLDDLVYGVETGEFNAAKEKKVFFDFLKTLRPTIDIEVDSFIKSDSKIAIFEINEIANTQSSLRITEMYLSSIFNWAKNNKGRCKIQIALEEAHTIIPEMTFKRMDKVETDSVVARISQIALQGRKYGVGLLVISQRTALVSKTVLSQCNTFFTFNLIDKTSLDFLRNIYGETQINLITKLKFLEVMSFGTAIKSENPIILELPFDKSL